MDRIFVYLNPVSILINFLCCWQSQLQLIKLGYSNENWSAL